MAWAKVKTIIYKLLVFAVNGSLYNPVSTIKIIIKNRVANMLHVHTYLVCAAGFQPAFYGAYIIKIFQNFIMRNGIFAVFAFWVNRK